MLIIMYCYSFLCPVIWFNFLSIAQLVLIGWEVKAAIAISDRYQTAPQLYSIIYSIEFQTVVVKSTWFHRIQLVILLIDTYDSIENQFDYWIVPLCDCAIFIIIVFIWRQRWWLCVCKSDSVTNIISIGRQHFCVQGQIDTNEYENEIITT